MKLNQLLTATLLAATTLFSAHQASAQDVLGKKFINAGVGLGTYGMLGNGGLPINGSIEYGFTEKISGGVFFGLVSRTYADDWKYRYTVAGARASYHVNDELNVSNPKVDLYGGLSLYYRGYKLKYEYLGSKYNNTDGTVGVGIHLGARYLFTDKFGGFAELGYGISPLQLGLAVKL